MNARLHPAVPVLGPLLALGLAACGTIPLPPRQIGDFDLPMRAASANLDVVAYEVADNRFATAGIPSFLTGVKLSGSVEYTGVGTAEIFDVYVRTTDPAQDPICVRVTDYVLCEAPREAPNLVGTVQFGADRRADVALTGASLDASAKNAQGYFGVRLRRGTTVAGDMLKLRRVTASARL